MSEIARSNAINQSTRRPVYSRRRKQQSGFAMLLVFLMASVVAIMLYIEIPRVAMDAQRQKEQLLIARGEQYKRAIQVFFKENKRYPSKIEELETLNNRRYLRKRYIDPMTGADEWRLIHVQNGVLTDSLVTKTNLPGAKPEDNFAWGGSTVGIQPGLGEQGTAGGAAGGVNLANRRRTADGQTPGVGVQDGQGNTDPNSTQQQGTPGAPVYPGGQPGGVNGQQVPLPPGMMPGVPTSGNPGQYPQPGFPGQQVPGLPGQPVQPGQPPDPTQNPGTNPVLSQPYPNPTNPGQYPGQYPGQQPVQYPGQQPVQYPGQFPGQQPVQFPGQQPVQYPGQQPGQYPQPVQYPGQQPIYPGQPVNSQNGGMSPQPVYPTTFGSNGTPPAYPQPGTGTLPSQQVNQAQMMIQQILTSPRPGGAPGLNNSQVIGGGIAGVASKADADGIMVYNDHTNYKEWEFIFDPAKLKLPPNPLTGAIGTPASQLGSMGGSPIGTPVTSMPGAGMDPNAPGMGPPNPYGPMTPGAPNTSPFAGGPAVPGMPVTPNPTFQGPRR